LNASLEANLKIVADGKAKKIDAPGTPRVIADHGSFVIAHKPPHWLIHPTRPTGEKTLLDWLIQQRPGEPISLINRLDRETSGLVLAATTTEAASLFGKMTMRREIDKQYLALVHGRVRQEHGLIEHPLGRIGISQANPIYIKQGVMADGAPSRTEFWLEQAETSWSLLRLRAHTGRLHQLRAHLAYINHPVVGDKIYGLNPELYLKFIGSGWTAEHERKLPLRRHALHAANLRFVYDGESFDFHDPLPTDMRDFIEAHLVKNYSAPT
jgi:23S rRNA pseudouridine1911/1915/1917 synthase